MAYQSLKTLDLSKIQIHIDKPALKKSFKTFLDSDNEINSFLIELDLSGNKWVDDDLIKSLACSKNFKNLVKLNLSFTKFTSDGAKEIF